MLVYAYPQYSIYTGFHYSSTKTSADAISRDLQAKDTLSDIRQTFEELWGIYCNSEKWDVLLVLQPFHKSIGYFSKKVLGTFHEIIGYVPKKYWVRSTKRASHGRLPQNVPRARKKLPPASTQASNDQALKKE